MKGTYIFEEKYSQILSLVVEHSVDCFKRMKDIAEHRYSRSCQAHIPPCPCGKFILEEMKTWCLLSAAS
jgi:hypothetical protein